MNNKDGKYILKDKSSNLPKPENATQKPQTDLRNEIKKGREARDGRFEIKSNKK